jgi:hypothetical protein
MLASATQSAPSANFRYLAVGAVVHAALVALLWASEIYFDVAVIPGRVWLILSWLWLLWPIVLLLHPDRSPMRVLVPSLIGLGLLAPCVPTIWLFTVWAVGGGFAP